MEDAGHKIEGLFTKSEAIQVLQEARPKLSLNYCSQQELEEFYNKLDLVADFQITEQSFTPTVIVLEVTLLRIFKTGLEYNSKGLDGCGKSTQAKLLASSIEGARLRATPPESMKAVRECFDRYGGMVARAFYLISNYVLAMEMTMECLEEKKNLVFIVDRFYSSTCAYTIGKATTGAVEDLKDLLQKNPSLTSWPEDLLKPNVTVILTIGTYFSILSQNHHNIQF